MPASANNNSADDTATDSPPTIAAPDTVSFSPDSDVLSSGTVTVNVRLADTPPAGIDTVAALPVKLVQASSPVPVGHDDANTAPPPPATVTDTGVAAARTDDVPLNRAVTLTDCAPDCSSSNDSDNTKSISASSSEIFTEPETPYSVPRLDVPPNANVSEPSTTASSTTDKPANVFEPLLLNPLSTAVGVAGNGDVGAGIENVSGVDGA